MKTYHNRKHLSRDFRLMAIAEGLGLGVPHAEVLLALLEADGPVTSQSLCFRVNPHRPIKLNALQERIRAIREVMGRDAIGGFKTAAQRMG